MRKSNAFRERAVRGRRRLGSKMPKPASDCRATGRNRPWPMVRLGDVCEVQRGGSPRPIKDYITDSTEGLNWIKIGDVEPAGKYITQTVEKIKASGLNKTRKVLAGDFLLSNSMSFGRPYILKIDGCIHDGWLVLKGFSKTFTEDFFYYLLRSPIVQEQFDKLAHGSTVRNLNTDVVSRVSLPLPPFSVQREIVARLERELAAVEKMKKGFEELAETARAEFKAELKEVFEEISRGGAETRRLGDVCDVLAGYAFKGNGFSATGVPICGGLIIAPDRIKWEECRHWPSVNGLEAYLLEAGDVVVALDRPWISEGFKVGMIDHDDCPCLLIQRTARLRAGKQIDNKYLLLMLRDERFREHCTTSGTTVPHISHKDIESYTIPFLSLSAQREVVARLDSAKARAEKLEAKAREGVAVCETMRKAILKEAFE